MFAFRKYFLLFAFSSVGCGSIEPESLTDKNKIESSLSLDGTEAVKSKSFQRIMGNGLATSWFKSYPVRNYSKEWLYKIKNKGFNHVRIRVSAAEYKGSRLSLLTNVIDQTLESGLVPIISWVNHEAELRASEQDQQDYLDWWSDVTVRLKGRAYPIGFNLFTEIGNESGLAKANKYNIWTRKVVKRIRAIDPKRIIILSAPSKVVKSLKYIDEKIYRNDQFILAEWHLYASGPNKKAGDKHWEGNGSQSDRKNVTSIFKQANQFTNKSGIPTYFGAWMPMDNNTAQLYQDEVEAFARFFVKTAKQNEIPWALNADIQFINWDYNEWMVEKSWGNLILNMADILDTIMRI